MIFVGRKDLDQWILRVKNVFRHGTVDQKYMHIHDKNQSTNGQALHIFGVHQEVESSKESASEVDKVRHYNLIHTGTFTCPLCRRVTHHYKATQNWEEDACPLKSKDTLANEVIDEDYEEAVYII